MSKPLTNSPWTPQIAARPNNASWHTLFAALLLGLAVWLLHGSALQGFWRVDDPLILRYISEHPSLPGYFFSPGQWQAMGAPFFTPWLTLDYWLDTSLFGLEPRPFYLRHLVMIWATALMSYLLLRRPLGQFWAGAASVLFLAGGPTLIVAQQLMSRHYVTGLLFMLLALYFWLQARGRAWSWQLGVATACYLAAMLNKEVYAPLPLVLLFLGQDSLRQRLAALVPFALTALGFVLWRGTMLGTAVGGYGALAGPRKWLLSLTSLPEALLGPGLLAPLALTALLLGSLWLVRRSAPLLLAAGLGITLPFLAVRVPTDVLDLRYLFLPWWGLCCLLAATGQELVAQFRQRTTKRFTVYLLLPLLLLIPLAALNHAMQQQTAHGAIASQFDVQGRFLWEHGRDRAYIPAGVVAGAMQFQGDLALLKKLQGLPPPPQVVPTPASAAAFAGSLPLHAYDEGQQQMLPLPTPAPQEQQSGLLGQIRLDRRQGGLEWFISDLADSRCFLLFPSQNVSFLVPCAGRIGFEPQVLARGELRVMVSLANGAWETTPPLQFPARGQLLAWP
ncbi:hypothetical protein [Azovibrio restrictus]|uniref:hypothetical protein n=1 Tax=Azovibrio restrictus TaxID=146938 RepID=UPI0026F331C6|nr:hypothetical protein [Azovibrio restrictus]MDD3482903.1 hypothetical protein [Azovibrio restrictus]